MQNGRRDDLLLRQQARADLDLPADTERINALIACALRRAYPDRLPVVISRPSVEKFDRLPCGADSDGIEVAVLVQVGRPVNLKTRRQLDIGVFPATAEKQVLIPGEDVRSAVII